MTFHHFQHPGFAVGLLPVAEAVPEGSQETGIDSLIVGLKPVLFPSTSEESKLQTTTDQRAKQRL